MYQHLFKKHDCLCISIKAVPLHAMEALWGGGYSSFSFTTSALDGDEWSVSRPGHALPQGERPRYPLYRRLGGPQIRLDTEARGKILCPCRGSNPDCPVVQPVVRHYTAPNCYTYWNKNWSSNSILNVSWDVFFMLTAWCDDIKIDHFVIFYIILGK
jgi:hypothetical protein